MPPDTAPRVETHLVPDEPLDVAQQSPATDVVALASDLGSFPCSARVSLHTPPAARLTRGVGPLGKPLAGCVQMGYATVPPDVACRPCRNTDNLPTSGTMTRINLRFPCSLVCEPWQR